MDRTQRLEAECGKLANIIKHFYESKILSSGQLVQACHDHDIDVSDIVGEHRWWNGPYDESVLLHQWLDGEVSEGYVSKIFGVSRIEARERLIKFCEQNNLQDVLEERGCPPG